MISDVTKKIQNLSPTFLYWEAKRHARDFYFQARALLHRHRYKTWLSGYLQSPLDGAWGISAYCSKTRTANREL